MSDKLKEQARRDLLEALERLQEDIERQREKREAYLWRECAVPCGLKEVLSRLTKAELDNIRQFYNFHNLSALKKNALTDALVERLPMSAAGFFSLLDEERHRLVKSIADGGGYVFHPGISLSKAEYLRSRGIIFTGAKEGRKILFMPLELVDAFRQEDKTEHEAVIRRNTAWVKITHGLLYYYGVLTFDQLLTMLAEKTGEKPDGFTYYTVLFEAMNYYEQIRVKGGIYYDARVSDPEKVLREQKARKDLAYRPFSRKQLMAAGEPGYIEQTPALKAIERFIAYHYDMPEDEINEMMEELILLIVSGSHPHKHMEYLSSRLELSSLGILRELSYLLTNLANTTRQWDLKGHTPEELFLEEKKHLPPLPPQPFPFRTEEPRDLEIKTRVKIGRNEPCPCGSGKKYKKCCGSTGNVIEFPGDKKGGE